MIVLITDPSKNDDELAKIAGAACRAVPAGKLAVLLRDKSRDDFGALTLATNLRKITTDAGQLLMMHRDHLRLAYEVGADGVHDPAPNLDGKTHKVTEGVIVSSVAHTDDDVTRAIGRSIDWLLVSPIFATPGKGSPRGLDAIRNAAKCKANHETPRIFALGGIDAKNAADCMHAGAYGVAVIRSILHAEDPYEATRALWNAMTSVSMIET